MELLFKIISCHLIGDYVLQCDFIAKSKGKNLYHLLVHCILYVVPFYITFGFDWRLMLIFLVHIVVDSMKARWQKIDYVTDQVIHYLVALVYVLS